MKSMNNMSMKELVETEKRLNWLVRQHEDSFAPEENLPEWAEAIDKDLDFQRNMGAFVCPIHGKDIPLDETFCCPECKKQRVNGWKLSQIEKKREETEKWLTNK